jgi:hypothetical protein
LLFTKLFKPFCRQTQFWHYTVKDWQRKRGW